LPPGRDWDGGLHSAAPNRHHLTERSLTEREFVASRPVHDSNNDRPTRLFAIGPASTTARSIFFQATAPGQQGGAGGGTAGAGLAAVGGPAAPAFDHVTI